MAVSFFQSEIYSAQFGDSELGVVFSDRQDVTRMVAFERALARVQGHLGVIPAEAGQGIDQGLADAQIDLDALAEGVCKAGVPVPALVAELRKVLPAEHGQWLHWGATSQDVIDVSQVLALKASFDILETRLAAVIAGLKEKSTAYATTVMAGRTRGQIATPITFGLRIAKWAQPLIALQAALPAVKARVLMVQFGGASGANTAIAPHGAAISEALAEALDLAPSDPWHVDRTALLEAAGWALQLVIALAKFSDDLILLMRSEIAEAKAGVSGGSSTMPQKSNPVGPETIKVLATLAKAAHAGLAASADHAEERDGAQWPVEWALLPQLFIATGAALRHGVSLAETLEARPERMQAILDEVTGVMAEQASFVLAAHMPRADAQALVKRAVQTGKPLSEGLAEVSDLDLDWARELDPASVSGPCQEMARSIFSKA